MGSKYDSYWQKLAPELGTMLSQAAGTRKAQVMDVSGIRALGERRSWYGRVEVLNGHIVNHVAAAHARSLGNTFCCILAALPLSQSRFVATMSERCLLQVTTAQQVGATGPSSQEDEAPLLPQHQDAPLAGSGLCREVHRLAWCLPRHGYPIRFVVTPGVRAVGAISGTRGISTASYLAEGG